jgi:hypothetical protein
MSATVAAASSGAIAGTLAASDTPGSDASARIARAGLAPTSRSSTSARAARRRGRMSRPSHTAASTFGK